MTIEDDINFLSRVPTFAKFGFAALQIVAIGSETRNLDDGEILFSAGEATDAGYVIQTGSLSLSPNDSSMSEAPVIFGPGALLGELALLTETVSSATAVAAEPTTVMRISRNLFRKVLEGFPDVAFQVRQRMMQRVNQANAELVRMQALLGQQQSKRESGQNNNPATSSPPPRSPAEESRRPPPRRGWFRR